MLFSLLLAGPVGVATDLGELAAEKITGVDPEKIGGRVLAGLGVHGSKQEVKAVESVASTKPAGKSASTTRESGAWSAAQLAAYGVTTTAAGELKLGSLEGSDVLNSMELDRLQARANAQYAATTTATS